MKRFFIGFIFLFSSIVMIGQNSIYGHVANSNGESLIQATVFLVGTYHAAITDD